MFSFRIKIIEKRNVGDHHQNITKTPNHGLQFSTHQIHNIVLIVSILIDFVFVEKQKQKLHILQHLNDNFPPRNINPLFNEVHFRNREIVLKEENILKINLKFSHQ